MKRPAYYIGRCPGCLKCVAATYVNLGHLANAADSVREFIAEGLTVEPLYEGRVTLEQCTCESEVAA